MKFFEPPFATCTRDMRPMCSRELVSKMGNWREFLRLGYIRYGVKSQERAFEDIYLLRDMNF